MSDPTVSYPVREVLARIENDVSALQLDIHLIQLAQASSSATSIAEVAQEAHQRSRWALITAVLSGPATALVTYWLTHHG